MQADVVRVRLEHDSEQAAMYPVKLSDATTAGSVVGELFLAMHFESRKKDIVNAGYAPPASIARLQRWLQETAHGGSFQPFAERQRFPNVRESRRISERWQKLAGPEGLANVHAKKNGSRPQANLSEPFFLRASLRGGTRAASAFCHNSPWENSPRVLQAKMLSYLGAVGRVAGRSEPGERVAGFVACRSPRAVA